MINFNLETVLEVRHFAENLFWFKTTKSEYWEDNFQAGQFTTLTLNTARAYSMANSPNDNHLEFLSTIIDGGKFTTELKDIKVGETLVVFPKGSGTLTIDSLMPISEEEAEENNRQRRLWLISTGTGIAPFLSLARHPETYEYYDDIIVVHTCRNNNELVFKKELVEHGARVFQSVTRQDPEYGSGAYKGRIQEFLKHGMLFDLLNINQRKFDKDYDRIMLCGSQSFNKDLKEILIQDGFIEGSKRTPGSFIQEKAFVG